jgi:hypothetical protein
MTNSARGAGESLTSRQRLSPAPRADIIFGPITWDYATLHPRLYAVACSAGWKPVTILESLLAASHLIGLPTRDTFFEISGIDFVGFAFGERSVRHCKGFVFAASQVK